MIHQTEIRDKLRGLKSGVKGLLKKISHKNEKSDSVAEASKLDHTIMYEFTPDDKVATSPRTKAPLSQGNKAQKDVWDNEDASMQDKSYSFDEDSTGSNELNLNGEDDR